ncbi:MAG: hypothetical protein SGI90_15945 [Candidatus Eisenbacteria bacterium]|nr:hypothetical protein [Candidatus Eisenbacteria bacterium]
MALLHPSIGLLLRHWSIGLLVLIGCGHGEQLVAPQRPLQGIGTGVPTAVTDCSATPCLCDDYPAAYEASLHSYHPVGYAGDGLHAVIILGAGPDIIHIWPATACGDAMATFATTTRCPICINFRGDTEPGMLSRTYSLWPKAIGQDVLLMARAGLAYYAFQDGHLPVRFDGTATVVRII